MTRFAAAGLIAALLASPLVADGRVVAGADSSRVVPPAGAVVEPYRNLGYDLRFSAGALEVMVDLAPIGSASPLVLPMPRRRGPVAERALTLAAGSGSRYEATTRILSWIRGHVRYELDRAKPQDPESVLARGSAYCTGVARLAVAMLAAVGIEAREVPGYVLERMPDGPRVGFHRWIEVHYPDRGWAFSDPLATLHYVPATYVRLGAERLEERPGAGSLLARTDAIEEIDLAPGTDGGLRVRRNDDRRSAAALVVRLVGAGAGEASLEGRGGRRTVRVEGGSGRFLGLDLGEYRLEVQTALGRVAHKDLVFRAPVLAELEIPVARPELAPSTRGEDRRGRGSR